MLKRTLVNQDVQNAVQFLQYIDKANHSSFRPTKAFWGRFMEENIWKLVLASTHFPKSPTIEKYREASILLTHFNQLHKHSTLSLDQILLVNSSSPIVRSIATGEGIVVSSPLDEIAEVVMVYSRTGQAA